MQERLSSDSCHVPAHVPGVCFAHLHASRPLLTCVYVCALHHDSDQKSQLFSSLLLCPALTWAFHSDPGGLPIGAVLVKQRVADAMAPGDHGSTFAGNPLVTAAADTVLDIIAQPAFLERVLALGERLRLGLRSALADNAHVTEVRGLGLITGIQLDVVRCCPSIPA